LSILGPDAFESLPQGDAMTDPIEVAARRLVDSGALHTGACPFWDGGCGCEAKEVLEAFAREVRRQALGEAARIAEAVDGEEHGGSQCCAGELVIAERLRALAEEPTK
jgi:hypothetical protein